MVLDFSFFFLKYTIHKKYSMFEHLTQVCMTYTEHMFLSLHLSVLFLTGSACAVVHAFLPNMYPSSSTAISNYIVKKIKNSGCQNTEPSVKHDDPKSD